MEKYRVENVKRNNTFSQSLDLVAINKKARLSYRKFNVYRVVPCFKVGDKIKIYTTKDNGFSSCYKACSYKLKGRMFVDFYALPQTSSQFENFYKDMSLFDALRLGIDVMRVLRARKQRPTLNAVNNLRLLLFDQHYPIRSM